ncbi:hypothetical protein IV75_GL001621 [Carnobacterium maltaromaticum]|uniref:type II restriction enzyme n=1 Tax=Carnobacterium maltaromaticum TaxID=2751 RepID=UPI000704CC66|nr:hypothetical protein [Carnobacterium maltaromaticum]EJO7700312.1 hypothetical protein [Listeria monocytogenes]KRN85907.1 hypothetical protein IV75_GL001621 [Carnobacterium maltaromaticum]
MVNKKKGKNDEAWEILFNHFNIVSHVEENNFFEITSEEINTIGRREARLMTKFDHSNSLPEQFKNNNLSILPNSRGTYLIGNFKTHVKLKYDDVIIPVKKKLPESIQSVDSNNITSESVALNIAYASGMIDDVIDTIENTSSYLTLSGRLGSKKLEFEIDSTIKGNKPQKISVLNSQIEIDSTYENISKIGVFEAKSKVPSDFLVRQLYYPYLYFKNMKLTKDIMPVFFTYAEGTFSFHIYDFIQVNNYSSIKRIKQLDFVLENDVDIELEEISKINNDVILKKIDGYIPFPQADNFIRVLDLLSFIKDDAKSLDDIALNYGFNVRQADYYFNALRYLGFAEKVKKGAPVSITKKGVSILKIKDTKKGKLEIVKEILSCNIFNECMRKTLNEGEIISKKEAKLIIKKWIKGEVIGKETMDRRASTIRGWINWILNVITK